MDRTAYERARFERTVLPQTRALRCSALRMSRTAADADDLVQETVLRAWRFWPHYTERDNSRAWLQRILRNTFLSRCRRATREREVLSLASCEPPQTVESSSHLDATSAHRHGLDDGLHGALDRLRSEHRDVLWLVDVQEHSYREAADELGVPIGTVMSRLHRARAAFRESFHGLGSSIARAASRAA